MTNFTQALERIDRLLEEMKDAPTIEYRTCNMQLRDTLAYHATNILELARVAEGLQAVLEHAVELGHLGEGSTLNWAKQEIAKLDALMKKGEKR